MINLDAPEHAVEKHENAIVDDFLYRYKSQYVFTQNETVVLLPIWKKRDG